MAEIYLTHPKELLIGILHILELIHKPCITIGIRILDGHSLSSLKRKDEILRVKHIEHRIDTVAVNLCHIPSSICYCTHRLLHLWRDILFDHLLIATQLGSMITSDTLMIIRSLILIEGVGSHIEYSVIKALIVQNLLVCLSHLLWSLTLTLRHEHLIIKITLVYWPEVDKTEYQQCSNSILLL